MQRRPADVRIRVWRWVMEPTNVGPLELGSSMLCTLPHCFGACCCDMFGKVGLQTASLGGCLEKDGLTGTDALRCIGELPWRLSIVAIGDVALNDH